MINVPFELTSGGVYQQRFLSVVATWGPRKNLGSLFMSGNNLAKNKAELLTLSSSWDFLSQLNLACSPVVSLPSGMNETVSLRDLLVHLSIAHI